MAVVVLAVVGAMGWQWGGGVNSQHVGRGELRSTGNVGMGDWGGGWHSVMG